MDWPKVVGMASTAIVGIQGLLKVWARLRMLTRPEKKGITIMNGEAKDLLSAIQRIEGRQDRHSNELMKLSGAVDSKFEMLSQRVGNIEQRLAT